MPKVKSKNQDEAAAQRKANLQALRNKNLTRGAEQSDDEADTGQQAGARRQEVMKLLARRRQGAGGGGQVHEGRLGAGRGRGEGALQKRPGLRRPVAQRDGGLAGAGGGVGAGLGIGQGAVDSSSTPKEIAEYTDRLTSGAARLSKALAKCLAELERVGQMVAEADTNDDVAESEEAATVTVKAFESKPAHTKKKPIAKKTPARTKKKPIAKKTPAKRGTRRK